MAAVKELIRTEADGTISFGDFELPVKTKKSDFAHEGDIYKVKTCAEITRLEKNEMFVFESDPGTAVSHLRETESGLTFHIEGPTDAQVTVQGESEADYDIRIDGELRDTQRSNLGGKISFSLELGESAHDVELIRK